MIVKNEAHCIVKCLESVKNYIDYWIVCDTGSTDGTQEIIKNYMRDVPGELHQHDWVDFSTNRNKALKLAESNGDYILVIDADDYLVCQSSDAFKELSAPAYRINFKHANITYQRVQLFKSNVGAKYIGVLHEYLDLPGNIIQEELLDCYIQYGALGARSQDPDKFLKDAKIFEEELKKDSSNSRNVFYCAQSYRDARKPESALSFYIKRSEMGGWSEEVYVSLLEAAKIIEKLFEDNPLVVQSSYLRAINYLPARSEAIYYLCLFCRKNKLFEHSYNFAKLGIDNKVPTSGLFVEPDCYNWKIQEELGLAAYYIGKQKEFEDITKSLLKNPHVPKHEADRIKGNIKYFKY